MSRTQAGILVSDARSCSKAVGAFNVILLEHAEAIVDGAQIAHLPVILQVSENCIQYHNSLKPISLATIAIAESSSIPVSVHLDHAKSEELVRQALDLGYDSVMFDGSELPYLENVAASMRMASLCKSYGATLEVEIGEVGGKDGLHAPGVRTNPLEAREFAEATGAHLLAVAVGSSHAMTTRDATLDFDLIMEIARSVELPLVLHGSSGVSDADLGRAVKAGMSKINVATHLNSIFTHEVRGALENDPALVDPRKYVGPARLAITHEVSRILKILG